MIDEYKEFGGMRIGRGNGSTLRKPSPVHFVHYRGKPATNSLNYGTAKLLG
jgi:hypothetical protein